MNTWVLIVAIFGQDGAWLNKYVEGPIKTQQECVQRVKSLPVKHNEMIFKGICVTFDHWTGKKPMPNVALD